MTKIYKKILFYADGSAHSDNIAKQIVEFQKEWNCKVVIFHSIKSKRYLSTLYPDNIFQQIDCKEIGQEILRQTKRIFDKAHISIELRLIEDEYPEQYIKRITKAEDFDLVILSSGGHHIRSEKTFLDTISNKLLKYTPCDVLIVR